VRTSRIQPCSYSSACTCSHECSEKTDTKMFDLGIHHFINFLQALLPPQKKWSKHASSFMVLQLCSANISFFVMKWVYTYLESKIKTLIYSKCYAVQAPSSHSWRCFMKSKQQVYKEIMNTEHELSV